ncbi:hypothetical protein EHI8A_036870 [Entamoeba histolytica HM-1:IMSS-B]|uniref:Uncharacterized protein n=6 Tax=Entamoeba histolytica TaxID=5759 RepID=C4M122_ENTH1|nr:hypothetical protein EHI_105170 [Entamoeba histolytica HM-1:IMSS]EMD45508.1 Hypothetical protein EHI5A_061720 [Entamoeba histolytica KU27]EMH72335.1 hypothetical protein EHI8A_036870 [Entamoeba histolytica HM-1:IMSS-B]EMS14791.1 hypothetical protein KM1_039080 [Entamoeba histolytica HM-3:IMSS]ENY63576.1 hypothetical protein EHI7A_009690 [Entamoeba histolytica HM-1:IMSS-A]GAT94894.1 hypothetical protein CL6EHI_105170 [Entamoeba histolytica]|eukprot:XP_650364.1 hypothetical protein EHI_105170 [Entamoeba histolytica HM-1:IMSS]
MTNVDLNQIFDNGVDSIIQLIKTDLDLSIKSEIMQRIADQCRDDEKFRQIYVKKEILEFIVGLLNCDNEHSALQACRCIVNLTYYNEPARNILLEIGGDKLKNISLIIEAFPNLRLVGISAYANLFESCEKLQEILIDDGFKKAISLCINDCYETVIRTLNNLTSTNKMNECFKSTFFVELLDKTPSDLADSDFSEVVEYFISVLSFEEFRKVFCKHSEAIFKGYKSAIDIIVSPLFPKNVDEQDLNQVCMSIKLVFDLFNAFYQFTETAKLYDSIIELTLAYTLHGNIYKEDYIPAPTQNHTCEILCHIATVEEFLSRIWDKHNEFIKIAFETSNNSRMMDMQKHSIGIIQSFSTNKEYVSILLKEGIMEKLSSIFNENNMMNQPLIYRSLSVLQNFTILAEDKNTVCNEFALKMIIVTFKYMTNIVIRYSAVQALRNILNFKPEFSELLKEEGLNALIDVCLGKDEAQEKKDQPDKRVRFEATRILVRLLKENKSIKETLKRDSDIYSCLLENLRTDYAILIKEVMELLIDFHNNGIILPNQFNLQVKEVVKEKLSTILASPKDNQLLNKDILELFEKFLAFKD